MWNDIRPTAIRKSSEKFSELRLKTDRDLRALLEKTIEQGFRLLARGDNAWVESTYAQAATLMSLVREIPPPELRRLENSLRELRAELDKPACWRQLAS